MTKGIQIPKERLESCPPGVDAYTEKMVNYLVIFTILTEIMIFFVI